MRLRLWGCASFVVLALMGCRLRNMDPDAGMMGSDAGRDAGRDAGEPFDAGPIDPGPALVAIDFAATFAALFATPLEGDADTLEGMGDTANDTTIRDRVENGVSGNSIVTDGTCVTYAWTSRTAMITFAGCTSEATGISIDGTVTLSVTLRPVEIAVTLDALTIDGTTIDGSVTMTVSGPDGARVLTVDGTVTWTDGTTSNSFTAMGIVASADATAMTATLDGLFSLTTGGVTYSGELMDVTWAMGDCHASSGSVAFTAGSGPTITVGFLPATPTNGTVSVTIPPFPAVEMDLLAPCTP